MDLQILKSIFNHSFQFLRMKKIQFIVSILFVICLYSCEKDSNVKLPKVEQKLVLCCVLSPQDKTIQVNVSLSQPIYNNTDANNLHEKVPNATVIISSGAGSWILPYDVSLDRYVIDTSQLKIRAGMTYDLSVSTVDGKFAKASTSVPFQSKTLTCTTSKNSTITNGITVHATWLDPESTIDYYKFEIQHKNGTNYYWNYRADNIKDNESDNGILRRDWPFEYDASANDSIMAVVYTVTPELYTYYDRIVKASNSGDPFSEPAPMYTNVEGGFGIFGGYNAYKISVLP
jgi:hypothetical protein